MVNGPVQALSSLELRIDHAPFQFQLLEALTFAFFLK